MRQGTRGREERGKVSGVGERSRAKGRRGDMWRAGAVWHANVMGGGG